MPYSFDCACGRQHLVEATQAGSALQCDCGQAVRVPTLSRLRTAAGETAVPLSVIGRINAMLRDGQLPTGKLCPLTGYVADATVWLHVQCESRRVSGGRTSDDARLAMGMLLGWIGLLIAWNWGGERVERGNDIGVAVPLRIAHQSRERFQRRMSQRRLKSLLRSVPIYEELLAAYPSAKVIVQDWQSEVGRAQA